MKKYLPHIKIVLLLLMVVGLYAFSNQRNNQRKIVGENVKFLGENKLFLTQANVSKLLIQNNQPLTEQPKEVIDLNNIEQKFNANPMVKKAEVFMTVDGEILAEIEQKNPIARVNTNTSYYIDDEGFAMPLSSNYSARVPLVTGYVNKNKLERVFRFAKFVQQDEFLKKHVIEIHQNQDHTISFRIRKSNFIVQLGSLKTLQKKINNFKAFYQKALKDQTLNSYKMVNLKFDKQVICTKKLP